MELLGAAQCDPRRDGRGPNIVARLVDPAQAAARAASLSCIVDSIFSMSALVSSSCSALSVAQAMKRSSCFVRSSPGGQQGSDGTYIVVGCH